MQTAEQDVMQLERQLRTFLDGERAPIMGPCLESIRNREPELLQHPTIQAIRKVLRQGDDSLRSFFSCLKQWPTITVLLVTEEVSQAYGDENEYAVHKAIEGLLGQESALSSANRKGLWRAFRSACYKIGLKVSSRESGVGYIVEEFLHQAGLPLVFVPKVTRSMIRTAMEVGLPDEDDPAGIRHWQECLLHNTKYLPPTAQKSLESDETGFYARTFLRVCASSILPSPLSVGGIMATVRSEERQHGSRLAPLRIPRLLWRNDELVIELPPGDDIEWTIRVDGEECKYQGAITAECVPVMTDLPRRIEVLSGSFSQEFSLWADSADNRFQLFDAEGRWVRASALGQPGLRVPPGEYVLVLRFLPTGTQDAALCVRSNPDLYVLSITLLPGEQFEIRRGPAIAHIEADFRPWIRFTGGHLTTAGGEVICLRSGLHLNLALGDRSEEETDSSRQYVVRLESGGEILGQVAVRGDHVPVESVCQRLGAGLHRLVAELCPEGTERGVARTAVLFWNGLERQDSDGRLHCSTWPENLISSGCENAALDRDAKEIRPRDRLQSQFRTEFQGKGRRPIILDWVVPGVFLDLEDYAAIPVERRRLRLGTLLAAPPNSRQVLRVRSTCQGSICIQGKTIRDVIPNRSVSLQVSSLAEYLKAGNGDLEFYESQTTGSLLLQLTAPHYIQDFTQQRTPRQYQLCFGFAAPCSHVRLRAENVLTGETSDWVISCDDPAAWSDATRARLESHGATPNGLFNYQLTVETRNWGAGAWLLDLDVCLAGRWGLPTNPRQESYCCGILVDHDGTTLNDIEDILQLWPDLMEADARLRLFPRVHQALQRNSYAPECWDGLIWLKRLWQKWVHAMLPLAATDIGTLARLCDEKPPATAPRSWIPWQRVEPVMLELFAMPGKDYCGLVNSDGVLASALGAIAQIELPLLHFPSQLFTLHLACGFGLKKMCQGAPPGAFSFDEYCSALLTSPLPNTSSELWQPMAGEYLDRIHYQVAWERLRIRYRDTLAGNESRRRDSSILCRRVEREMPAPALLLHIREQQSHVDTVEGDVLKATETFLSALARECRSDVSRPQRLSKYRHHLATMLPEFSCSVNDVLSYVLQLGPDLFAFYLLLWEIILVAEQKPEACAVNA